MHQFTLWILIPALHKLKSVCLTIVSKMEADLDLLQVKDVDFSSHHDKCFMTSCD